jgi:uncharacterized membrane protein YoaK (UPF0700 family)
VPLAAVPAARMHLCLMQVLTFTTGVNDAVGYLGLDRVFTGNMTGNVVVLGMALTGRADLPVLGPLLALVGFMVGAAAGGRALGPGADAWSTRTTLVLASTAALLGVVGAGLLLAGDDPGHAQMVAAATGAAIAMGLQAAAARTVAVKDVTTVVVTSTITGLAADSFLGSRTGSGSARRALVVVMLLAGAACGALLLQAGLGVGLLLAGLVVGVVTAVGDRHRRVLLRGDPA